MFEEMFNAILPSFVGEYVILNSLPLLEKATSGKHKQKKIDFFIFR